MFLCRGLLEKSDLGLENMPLCRASRDKSFESPHLRKSLVVSGHLFTGEDCSDRLVGTVVR